MSNVKGEAQAWLHGAPTNQHKACAPTQTTTYHDLQTLDGANGGARCDSSGKYCRGVCTFLGFKKAGCRGG